MFVIEEIIHAEHQGEFATYDNAFEEIKRRSTIPFDKEPNKCPCSNWEECERQYQIIEFDDKVIPWEELNRKDILIISKKGIEWKSHCP